MRPHTTRPSLVRRASVCALILAAAACSGDEPSVPTPPAERPRLQLADTAVVLDAGASRQLAATVTGAANTAVLWRTAAPAVATVSAAGEIRGVAPGTAVVTAKAVADTTVTAHVTVTVRHAAASVKITTAAPRLARGDTLRLAAVVRRADGSALDTVPVQWESTRPDVAALGAIGAGAATVRAVADGDAWVRARVPGAGIADSVALAVGPVVGSIELYPRDFVLMPSAAARQGLANGETLPHPQFFYRARGTDGAILTKAASGRTVASWRSSDTTKLRIVRTIVPTFASNVELDPTSHVVRVEVEARAPGDVFAEAMIDGQLVRFPIRVVPSARIRVQGDPSKRTGRPGGVLLASPPVVDLVDDRGIALSSPFWVEARVTAGGGAVAPRLSYGDTTFRATARAVVPMLRDYMQDRRRQPIWWRMGDAGPQALEVRAGGAAAPVTVTTTARSSTSGFTVKVVPMPGYVPTAAERAMYDDVIHRVREVITGALPTQRTTLAAGACGTGSPAIDETTDGLVLIVGRERSANFGGVCALRTGGQLPAVSYVMWAGGAYPEAGVLAQHEVFIHELTHALGLGGLYWSRGLATGRGTGNAWFTGARATAEFRAEAGDRWRGPGVPLERAGGGGFADVHWWGLAVGYDVHSLFQDPDWAPNGLSRFTAGAFQDLGYAVDLGMADPWGDRWEWGYWQTKPLTIVRAPSSAAALGTFSTGRTLAAPPVGWREELPTMTPHRLAADGHVIGRAASSH